ncbi:MAG: hypothetical protein WA116_05655 [Anaerolineaceae bacterium]
MEKSKINKQQFSAFWSYTGQQIRWQLMRKRWYLPVFLGLLLAMRAAMILQGGPNVVITKPANAWDVLFSIFGSTFIVHFAIATAFLYLIGDLLPEPAYGQLTLFRLQSRQLWWSSKILTLICLTLVFVVTLTASILLVGGLTHGWSSSYSELAKVNWYITGFPANLFRNGTPYISVIELFQQTLLLLFLALFTSGLVVLTVDQLTSKSFWGLIAGFAFIFVSFIGNILSGSPDWVKWLPSQHFAYIGGMPVRNLSVLWSYTYWIILIGVLVAIGYIRAVKQDIFSNSNE